MNTYHKINTVFKRTPKRGELILGDWADPVFDYLKENKWRFREKVDGTNIRIKWDGKAISYGGKTDNAQIFTGLFDKLNQHFQGKEEFFKEAFGDSPACLYGEGYGSKIQSGGKYRQDQDFALFDVLVGQWWLEQHNIEDVSKRFGIGLAPIVGEGTLDEMIGIVSAGMRSTWGDFQSEGIVATPIVEMKTRSGHRIITKLKTKDFARAVQKQ